MERLLLGAAAGARARTPSASCWWASRSALVVGILPGLGGAATLSMMLPFVYPMDAMSAFAFLLGMHAVTATTGDITSVLFGIPGEATSAATVLDGYPMTRRGEAGRALGAVLFSSLVGALVGAAVLAVSVPVIRPIVLAFGPPEFLMLTLLGLSFIISLVGQEPDQGLHHGGVRVSPRDGRPRSAERHSALHASASCTCGKASTWCRSSSGSSAAPRCCS